MAISEQLEKRIKEILIMKSCGLSNLQIIGTFRPSQMGENGLEMKNLLQMAKECDEYFVAFKNETDTIVNDVSVENTNEVLKLLEVFYRNNGVPEYRGTLCGLFRYQRPYFSRV